jgi:hypothetical protein
MNSRFFLLPLFAAVLTAAVAQSSNPTPEPKPPVSNGSLGGRAPAIVDNQRLYGPGSNNNSAAPGSSQGAQGGQDLLVPSDVVNNVIAKFRTAYGSASAPRIVIYVNRELIDTSSGIKLTGHTENYERAGDTTKTTGTNTYSASEKSTPTLADKQTVRDIERLFGRVFRNGGAKLADQKVAEDLLADKPDQRLLGDNAARQREALSGVADIAIEVLISSRNLTLPGLTGDKSVMIPDIQATAIRLKDAAILGQASASEIIGKGQAAGQAMRSSGVPEITEGTAIALMQDMLVSAN